MVPLLVRDWATGSSAFSVEGHAAENPHKPKQHRQGKAECEMPSADQASPRVQLVPARAYLKGSDRNRPLTGLLAGSNPMHGGHSPRQGVTVSSYSTAGAETVLQRQGVERLCRHGWSPSNMTGFCVQGIM